MGKHLSKQEREEASLQTVGSLVYGEIILPSFALILEKIRLKYGVSCGILQSPGVDVFCDVGSGVGKVCIAAALYHDFAKVMGVEILTNLYECSAEVKKEWDDKYRGEANRNTEVEFFLGDAMDPGVKDWSEATIVLANSTCFDEALMGRLATQCERLSPGSFVVTFTKRLPSPEFELLEQEMHVMSWGGATVFIQQRRAEPQESQAS